MPRSLALTLCAYVFSLTAYAQSPAPDMAIPSGLKDWRAWVLQGFEYRSCPLIANRPWNEPASYLCAWPGRLTLSTGADGATFSMHWRVEQPS